MFEEDYTMIHKIQLRPVEMTTDLMADLEDRKLIIRLSPGHHDIPAKPGKTLDKVIYSSKEKYGPHMLIGVTVNNPNFSEFGTHPDNEEFLLIGNPDTKPLYLAIALQHKEALQQKIADKNLSAEDFVCLHIKYNDPEVSFFTMLADVPHGEATVEGEGELPSFYVTESKDLGQDMTDFGDYQIVVADLLD
jgi:hypothetical protein